MSRKTTTIEYVTPGKSYYYLYADVVKYLVKTARYLVSLGNQLYFTQTYNGVGSLSSVSDDLAADFFPYILVQPVT